MLKYLRRLPAEKTAEPPVLIMLHGYGSNKEDLFSLAPYCDPRLMILSAEAPFDMAEQGVPGGFAWFPLTFTPAGVEYAHEEARQGIAEVLEFINTAPQKEGGDPKSIFLLGFSQGAMVAHGILLKRPGLVRGVAALSGRMAGELFEKGKKYNDLAGFPLFVSHGWYDEVLPIHHGRAIRDFYKKTPVELEYREYPMGHEISPDCLNDLKIWMKAKIDAVKAASQ